MVEARSDGGDRWITSGAAARRLEVTSETIRRWVDGAQLDGFSEMRQARKRYFVSERAVAALQHRRRGGSSPDDELHRLRERVAELEATQQQQELGRLSDERDHYRAENSALREAGLRLNAAMEQMERAASAQAAALHEQRQAVSILLTPHSAPDLQPRPS